MLLLAGCAASTTYLRPQGLWVIEVAVTLLVVSLRWAASKNVSAFTCCGSDA